MDTCDNMSSLLVDYINRRLEQKETIKVAMHLAQCDRCRKEVAMLLSIENVVQKSVQEVPDDILSSAFDMIVVEEKASYFDYCFDAIKTVKDSFSIVRKTIGFAFDTITV